jgi:hypothetical protein
MRRKNKNPAVKPNFVPKPPAWTVKSECLFIDETLSSFKRDRKLAWRWGMGYIRGLHLRAVWANGEKMTGRIRTELSEHLFARLLGMGRGDA